jgi:hypothetical protein
VSALLWLGLWLLALAGILLFLAGAARLDGPAPGGGRMPPNRSRPRADARRHIGRSRDPWPSGTCVPDLPPAATTPRLLARGCALSRARQRHRAWLGLDLAARLWLGSRLGAGRAACGPLSWSACRHAGGLLAGLLDAPAGPRPGALPGAPVPEA